MILTVGDARFVAVGIAGGCVVVALWAVEKEGERRGRRGLV